MATLKIVKFGRALAQLALEAAGKAGGRDFVVAQVAMTMCAEGGWRLWAPLEEDHLIVPFWIIRAASIAAGSICWSPANLETHVLDFTQTNHVSPKDAAHKSMKKMSEGALRIKLPYLSNPAPLQEGAVLTCSVSKKRKAGVGS